MLSNNKATPYGTYGFRFKEAHQQRITGIYSLGWEEQLDTSYDWNGLSRSEKDVIVFQYTLKGVGEIRVGDNTHRLETGSAFFVKIPSDHRYYLPQNSTNWEFIHITLFGEEAIKCYESITDKNGHILKLDLHSSPIAMIYDLFRKVLNNEIKDAYVASSFAYSFLMELKRYTLNIRTKNEIPKSITKAVTFIKNNFASQLSLDDIVEVSGLSKYYFTRLFHQNLNTTPIEFLSKTRINKSIELLNNTELTIEEIAISVGFANGNYFGKVFRAYQGISPGKYRNNKSFIPMDHLIGDY